MALVIHTSARSIRHMRPGVADHHHRWRLPRDEELAPEAGDDLLFVDQGRIIGRATISDVQHGGVWFQHVVPADEPFRPRRHQAAMYEIAGDTDW
jgi:hypothetical protein